MTAPCAPPTGGRGSPSWDGFVNAGGGGARLRIYVYNIRVRIRLYDRCNNIFGLRAPSEAQPRLAGRDIRHYVSSTGERVALFFILWFTKI